LLELLIVIATNTVAQITIISPVSIMYFCCPSREQNAHNPALRSLPENGALWDQHRPNDEPAAFTSILEQA
jgi:hypothetical protein